MTKKSGLFGFIELSINDQSIKKLPMGQDVILINADKHDKSPAYLLLNKNLNQEINPFIDLGYKLDKKNKKLTAHLRIDRDYFSENSDYINRRNLSYCHGTEYFFNEQSVIKVHYYFDRHGNYTHDLCTKDNEILNTNKKQSESLKKRAATYGEAINKLLDLKNQKHAEMTKELEILYKEVSQEFMSSAFKLEKIQSQLTSMSKLHSNKCKMDESFLDKRFDLFLSVLNGLVEANRPVKKSVAANNSKTLTKELANYKPSSVVPETGKNDISVDLERRLLDLVKTSAAINSATDTNVVIDYVKNLNILQIDILYLKVCAPKSARVIQWSKIKTEIELCREALHEVNYDRFKELFCYCSNAINHVDFEGFVNAWMYEDISNHSKIAEYKKIADFLHENSNAFASFVSDCTIVMDNGNEPAEFSLLAASCYHRHAELFGCLLDYGLNPNLPWIMSEGSCLYAYESLVCFDIPNNYFIEKIIECGCYPQSPRKQLTTAKKVLQMASPKSLIKKRIDRRMDDLNKQHPTVERTLYIISDSQEELDLVNCPLRNLALMQHSRVPNTYEQIAKHSKLSSLLFSLAELLTINKFSMRQLINRSSGGIKYVIKTEENAKTDLVRMKDMDNHKKISFVIMLNNGMSAVCRAKAQMIIDVINARFDVLQEHEYESTLEFLRAQADKCKTLEEQINKTHCYMAVNFLYALSGELSSEQMIDYAKNWQNVALCLGEHFSNVKLIVEKDLRDILRKKEDVSDTVNFIKNFSEYMYVNICYCYLFAIESAYYSPYYPQCVPDVTGCFAKLNSIFELNKLPEEAGKIFKSYIKTPEHWEEVASALKRSIGSSANASNASSVRPRNSL